MTPGTRIRGVARLVIAALLVGLPSVTGARAQLPPGPHTPPPSGQPGTSQAASGAAAQRVAPAISVETELVHFDVLVTDEDGRVLAGLKQANFRVFDNGKPQPITNFATVDAPITIVMLVENSSAAYEYFAYKAAYWGSRFLDRLEPKDWVALISYDIRPHVRVDFTRNKAAVRQALSSFSYPAFREANLFDALADTLDRLARVKGKKSILLITTGADTFSKSSLNQTYDHLRRSDVTVFCVGIAEAEFMAAESRGQISSMGHLRYLQSKNQLQTFARITGGNAWFPRFEGAVPDIFESVAVILRNQYRLGFSPPDSARDGKYHKLKVVVVAPDGKPLKVTDQKGRRRKVEVYAREGYVAPKDRKTR